jgi:G3E family GTPase
VHWSWQSTRAFSLDKLRVLLKQLPTTVYRAKGIVAVEEMAGHPVALQLVGHRSELKKLEAWPDGPRGSRLVMIANSSETDFGAIQFALEESLGTRSIPAG